MKKFASIAFGIIVFLGLIVLSNSIYIVYEDEVAVVKAFGKMVSVVVSPLDEDTVLTNQEINGNSEIKIISEKGLHFKVPFINSVEKYSGKYLTYTSDQPLINTKDERRIVIQMYAQYRIIDPIVYKKAVGSEYNAQSVMDNRVYKTVINAANTLEFNEFFYQNTFEDLLISKQETLNEELVSEFGLYVSDIGINRKSFPDSNITNIEEKMAKEIEKDSEKLIAEGDSEYLQAQAITDREKAVIVSAAVEEAAVIKAGADAEAIRIYQESLKKDLGFYQFITRMEIYKNVKDTTVFLDGDNAIFDMLDGYDVLEEAAEVTPVVTP